MAYLVYMEISTQMDWVRSQLEDKGSVSRNQALNKHITRLAARINDLRSIGWNIVGLKEGKDYSYKLIVE